MKALIFCLLAACVDDAHDLCHARYVVPGTGRQIYCKAGYQADCGMHLHDCDDGSEWFCVQNVRNIIRCEQP